MDNLRCHRLVYTKMYNILYKGAVIQLTNLSSNHSFLLIIGFIFNISPHLISHLNYNCTISGDGVILVIYSIMYTIYNYMYLHLRTKNSDQFHYMLNISVNIRISCGKLIIEDSWYKENNYVSTKITIAILTKKVEDT